MFKRIQRLFKGSCRRTAPRRTALGVEQLEDRTVPAGVVNATFAAGVLTLTAVNDPTDVNIVGTNHQNITLDSAGGNNITVLANDGETGTAFTGSPFNGVTSIRLVLGLGNDRVTITDTQLLTGTVTFLGGSGNNTLNIDGDGTVSGFAGATPGNVTLNNLVITNGEGSDGFQVGGGNNTINGNVTISNGAGGSFTGIGSTVGVDVTTIGGAFKITNLGGFDSFQTEGSTATFTGAVTISNGNGGSRTAFNATTTSLAGGITLTNGAGSIGFFSLQNTNFTVGTAAAPRNLTIRNGNGPSFVELNAATNTINGNFSVANGVGQHSFEVQGTDFTVTGKLTIKNGNGGSDTSLRAANSNTIGGAFSLTNGDGDDTLEFGGTTVELASVTVQYGAGNSDTAFDANSAHLAGDLSISAGDGFDEVEINSTVISGLTGNVTLNYGAGGSFTSFNRSSSVATSTIVGRLTITGTDGDDFVSWRNTGVGAATAISLGNGNDTVEIDNAVLTGSFRLATGAGSDLVDIETLSDDGITTLFQAAALIDAGSGDDRVTFGSDADDFADFRAPVTLTGGLDLDTLIALANVNNQFAAPPVESGWEQGT